eukprot:3851301-Prymnesium_polylepis.1
MSACCVWCALLLVRQGVPPRGGAPACYSPIVMNPNASTLHAQIDANCKTTSTPGPNKQQAVRRAQTRKLIDMGPPSPDTHASSSKSGPPWEYTMQ